MSGDLKEFEPWLALWNLVPEGEVMRMSITGNRLLPVSQGDVPAMLKLAVSDDERRGGAVMTWWNGAGAAPVLAHQDEVLLLLRAEGPTLATMSREGSDPQATAILCEVIAGLHQPRASQPVVPSLADLFRALLDSSEPALAGPRAVAADLLATQIDLRLLHGDMHHDNVLDFGARGWLAIDPWGVMGERAYDYANIFRNPDLAAITPERFQARLQQISAQADLDPRRLAQWAYAHAGLSAAWDFQDENDSEAERSMAVISIAEAMI